jgi:50S ribosomal protein uL3
VVNGRVTIQRARLFLFDSRCHSPNVTLSHDKLSVVKSSGSSSQATAYGTVGFSSGVHFWEFRVEAGSAPALGTKLDTTHFATGQWVDVIGETKGKGFAGVVKRYHFGGLRMTHGSMMHRRTGAIGCRLTPGRVWKNQRMPGHMGCDRRTTQNLQIVGSRPEDNILFISGSIPGAKNSLVVIRPAKKRPAPEAK